ncbi:MAG: putative rane protein, partial [Dehalococcoidia bacterium]|nr:putative rane protein [Dehalococcoidia bacterium]
MQERHNGHQQGATEKLWVPATIESFRELNGGVLERLQSAGSGFQLAVAVSGGLFLLGILGFIMRLQGGFEDRAAWGYYATVWVFLFTTVQAAPVVAVATRLAKGHWRRPLSRTAEICAVVGLFNLVLYLPLLALMPPREGRSSMWFDWPIPGGPVFWDFLSVVFLTLCGVGLLYLSALPDFALLRDHTTGRRRSLYSFLAHGWVGTKHQWKMTTALLNVLGPFYLMMYVFTSSMIAMDYSMSLVPGWHDAIYPAFHTIKGLQGAVATTLIAMWLLRRFGGLKRYLGEDQFWGLSKPLLALTLLWFYHWWATFITFWYGRLEGERQVLQLLMFGPYF